MLGVAIAAYEQWLQDDHSNLSELLEQVTDENLHGEIGTGEPVGAEAW